MKNSQCSAQRENNVTVYVTHAKLQPLAMTIISSRVLCLCCGFFAVKNTLMYVLYHHGLLPTLEHFLGPLYMPLLDSLLLSFPL